MSFQKEHLSVCVCSYKRPQLLNHLMIRLQCLVTENLFSYSILVVDNDKNGSSRCIIADFKNMSKVPIEYYVEPEKGYSTARNKLIEEAKGNYIVFIDDDEFPEERWLLNLYKTCIKCKADGVLGPVKPHFNNQPPKWILESKLCEKPGYRIKTGTVLNWSNTRTSNVIIDKRVFQKKENRFKKEFGATGGEDVDFFKRMIEKGYVFLWCEEAVVYETIPMERLKKTYFMKRALLQGAVDTAYLDGNKQKIFSFIKTTMATFLYSSCLPVLLVTEYHMFMKYFVKYCHHVGRLLAMFGIVVVKERRF